MIKLLNSFICILVLYLVFPTALLSKCPNVKYTITGLILSENSMPVSGASVTVFFDKLDYGYSGSTSSAGEFEIEYFFNSHKRVTFFGDECGKRPSSLTVVITADKFYAKKQFFKMKSIEEDESKNMIMLPDIQLMGLEETQ